MRIALLASLAALPALIAAADDQAVTLWRDRAWNYDWDERLAAQGDESLFPGFGRHARRVTAGAWGALEVSTLFAGEARAAYAPGMAPVYDGGQGRVLAESQLAIGHVFLGIRPETLIAFSGEREAVPNGDARQIWTGADPDHRYRAISVVPRATVGTWAVGHLIAAANEPVQWGEGVFSGAVLGRAWRGFPHLVVAPIEPWTFANSDFAIDYQLIGGVLDDARPTREDPWLVGYRLAARWRWLTLSASLAVQSGGGDGADGTALLSPATSESIVDDDGNRVMALGLRLTPLSSLALVGEYALDDSGGDERPTGHPHGAAWLAGFDWLDVTGDQDWRLAFEWSRAEGAVYHHPRWPWEYANQSLGYPEGGNSAAARLLLQHQIDVGSGALILGWERRGWRNLDDGNDVGTQPDALRQPGGPALAPADWTTWSATLHLEFAVTATGDLLLDIAGFLDDGQGFVSDEDSTSAAGGLGWRQTW